MFTTREYLNRMFDEANLALRTTADAGATPTNYAEVEIWNKVYDSANNSIRMTT